MNEVKKKTGTKNHIMSCLVLLQTVGGMGVIFF